MKGIYFHIPFCRQACRYCDFYFTVRLSYRDDFIKALLEEIRLKGNMIGEDKLSSIYFGGGTPSVLSYKQLAEIMEQIYKNYNISSDVEITIEANPDDLSKTYLKSLLALSFNRLSIGVQSFLEKDLTLMRRSHTSEQARDSIRNAADLGFNNINMDLIYGLPEQGIKQWEENLAETMKLPVQHLSAYHLTYEPRTVFYLWKKKGRISELPEDVSINQFLLLRRITRENSFDHYEISNFAREGFRSRHNQLYWKGNAYIGYGPSAHSFMNTTRQWNVSSLKEYMQGVLSGGKYYEKEELGIQEQYHDYILTRLRIEEGVEKEYIHKHFGESILLYFEKNAKPYLHSGDMIENKGRVQMTEKGWMRSDLIIQSLMLS